MCLRGLADSRFPHLVAAQAANSDIADARAGADGLCVVSRDARRSPGPPLARNSSSQNVRRLKSRTSRCALCRAPFLALFTWGDTMQRTPLPRRARGFTLIELLVVIAIIAILVS